MSKFSVKKPFVVLVGVVIILVLGYVSFTKMTTDFMPNMNMPYMLVITTYPGASPEKVEKELTEKLEGVVGTVNGVKNVTSSSQENSSIISLEFGEKTNMDAAMVKVSSAVNQVEMPEKAGKPMIMQISMDMMATMMVSVDCDGKKGYELSDFVNEKIIPELERQEGVASVKGSGMVEKSVEVKLNQDKIDDVNGQVLEKTNKTLAKAKRKLDKAKEKLNDGKDKIEGQEDELKAQQSKQSQNLAKYSKLMNQALATKQAYSSELTSLQAKKTALAMEKKAYNDKVVPAYKATNQGFSSVLKSFEKGGAVYDSVYNEIYNQIEISMVQAYTDAAGMNVKIDTKNVETYRKKLGSSGNDIANTAKSQATTQTVKQMETQKKMYPKNVKDAIDSKAKLNAYVKLLKSQGMTKEAKQMTTKNLKSMYDIVEVRIPQINVALGNLKTEILAAKNILKQVEKSIKSAEDKYEQVEEGKITAAAAFGTANAQISNAKTVMKNSEKELEAGIDSYKKSKKEALKNANLDNLLTMEQLANILSAENFSMPAGYISEDNTQYLIKVGDEYSGIDELKNSVLCKIDDIGDVKLSDVADVTIVDNAEDSYGRVNGNEAVLLSVSKSSTAGTSDVSKDCNKKIKELQKKYKGLHITNLMDQGEYIELIVDNVLSNLLWGALLAIIVLFIFLRDLRPTVVVAFSIPISVLFAIVLMYFTNITLNVVSLSGLALGVGMLVDNSIVVVENIYRLRSKGLNPIKAAVLGANQVAGAVFSSTLTTICVFLPIIFTEGMTKQIMLDMCLTITYSLTASLIVALTLVPCLGSNLFRKNKDKKHVLLDIIGKVYEKVLVFCLRFKFVPIIVSVLLLIFSIWQVTEMGIVFMPEMGSDQLSASVTLDDKTSTEEDYALIDKISAEMKEIKGVTKVGVIKGNDDSITLGLEADKDYTFVILLDEKYANENTRVANEMKSIFDKNKCEEYKVQKSNMDTSNLSSTGLSIDIYGKDIDKNIKISEDVMKMVREVKGFEEPENGQEDGDKVVSVKVNKKKAMRLNLTVAQIYAELNKKLTTEKDSTTLTIDDKDYKVNIVDDREELNTENLLEYEFETSKVNDKGETKKETHKLKEFATMKETKGVASLNRDNLVNYIRVTAGVKDGYNTTLLSRKVQKKIDNYKLPDGYTIEVGGEVETNMDMIESMVQMILLAIVLVYLIMVAQFQGLLSPFIVILTMPLAFTGGLIALLLTGEQLSVMSLMGFLVLSGVVVNNGIVFVDYVNKVRLSGVGKREALVIAGKTRMRPIFMTALTTILAMSVMAVSKDSAAAMSRGMAIVTIGGLAYATLMTLFIVPVFYDILYRRKLKKIDIGEDDDFEDDDII